jgi:NADH:ubiquinone oxidoreductase subunit 3 (subunit A)
MPPWSVSHTGTDTLALVIFSFFLFFPPAPFVYYVFVQKKELDDGTDSTPRKMMKKKNSNKNTKQWYVRALTYLIFDLCHVVIYMRVLLIAFKILTFEKRCNSFLDISWCGREFDLP